MTATHLTATDRTGPDGTGPGRATGRTQSLLDRPLTSLHLVLVSGGLLLGIGMVMVLSASMFESYRDLGTTYGVFARQLMWLGIGVPAFWLGIRLPPRAYRLLAYPALLLAAGLLAAVLLPGIGESVHQARRWIDFGPIQLQPSEPAKLALTLWGADLLVRKRRLLGRLRHLALPLLLVTALLAGLVMLEPDLGTTLCLGLVLFGLLWTAGTPARFFALVTALVGAAVVGLIYYEPYRLVRLTAFLDPFHDRSDTGYQAVQGLYSLSTGGLFGVGLGQSKMKWGLLPNAHTDYIFAIVGEELGLVGCLVVLLLFATLGYAGIRIARRTADPFVRLAAAAATTWLVGQAVINMGYVCGLLPVTGIPLPLISFGGTSLVVTLFVLGMLASFARHEPAAVAHLGRLRRGWLTRLFLLPQPRPYVERPRTRRRRAAARKPVPRRRVEPSGAAARGGVARRSGVAGRGGVAARGGVARRSGVAGRGGVTGVGGVAGRGGVARRGGGTARSDPAVRSGAAARSGATAASPGAGRSGAARSGRPRPVEAARR